MRAVSILLQISCLFLQNFSILRRIVIKGIIQSQFNAEILFDGIGDCLD